MSLTARVLDSLRGRLGITVFHPDIDGKLVVVGATNDAVQFGWHGMPEAMKVPGRTVHSCRAEWSNDPYYVFEDEITIVDAPADMVVDALMDLVGRVNPDVADRVWYGEDGEFDEDDDWICEGAP